MIANFLNVDYDANSGLLLKNNKVKTCSAGSTFLPMPLLPP